MHAQLQSPQQLQMRRKVYGGSFGYEIAALNPEVVAEVLEYLFNTTSWKSNPELLQRRVSRWRLGLFLDGPGSLSTGATAGTATPLFGDAEPVEPFDPTEIDPAVAWIEQAIARRMEGFGWSRLSVEFGKDRSTVRRVIGKAMAERGLVAPTMAGAD